MEKNIIQHSWYKILPYSAIFNLNFKTLCTLQCPFLSLLTVNQSQFAVYQFQICFNGFKSYLIICKYVYNIIFHAFKLFFMFVILVFSAIFEFCVMKN